MNDLALMVRAELLFRLAEVVGLHRQVSDEMAWCRECQSQWPCDTIMLATGLIGSVDE